MITFAKFSEILEQTAALSVDDRKKTSDEIILRQAIVAEFDAVSLYEQMSRSAKNPRVKKLLLDIAQEEKVHIGELEGMLETLDPEHKPSTADGRKEMKNVK
jgi:rubrerythrin